MCFCFSSSAAFSDLLLVVAAVVVLLLLIVSVFALAPEAPKAQLVLPAATATAYAIFKFKSPLITIDHDFVPRVFFFDVVNLVSHFVRFFPVQLGDMKTLTPQPINIHTGKHVRQFRKFMRSKRRKLTARTHNSTTFERKTPKIDDDDDDEIKSNQNTITHAKFVWCGVCSRSQTK